MRRIENGHLLSQTYHLCLLIILCEGDASTASYFLAGAAITGGTVTVEGCGRKSARDIGFGNGIRENGSNRTLGGSFDNRHWFGKVARNNDHYEYHARCGNDFSGCRLWFSRRQELKTFITGESKKQKGKQYLRNCEDWELP